MIPGICLWSGASAGLVLSSSFRCTPSSEQEVPSCALQLDLTTQYYITTVRKIGCDNSQSHRRDIVCW